jgi:hypothetical protein
MEDKENAPVGKENTSAALRWTRSILTCIAVALIGLILPPAIYSVIVLIIAKVGHVIYGSYFWYAALCGLLPGTTLILIAKRIPIPLKIVSSIGYLLLMSLLMVLYMFFFNCIAVGPGHCP